MKLNYARALPKAWLGLSKVFTALGDESRQRMLLLFAQNQRLNAGQIVDACPLAQSTVSHHLKILREAGLLQREKVGKEVFFSVDKERLRTALAAVIDYVDEQK